MLPSKCAYQMMNFEKPNLNFSRFKFITDRSTFLASFFFFFIDYNQFEIFSDGAPVEKHPVNIHEVLQYVISIAKAGFAHHVTFKELYDPSLPDVASHRGKE